jgi:D-alanyl-D-alanine carboxypeptidase/D-alanyl-D-alanine-endopeptidase (penicillin-binding protein 4)
MMQASDNFIAEQLLLVCANILGDSIMPEIPIEYVKKNFLYDLPDNPIWIDGSGLSRYNLFTPRSIVKLWEKIYQIVPRERLFNIVAVGGESGTIKNLYKGDQPYIFGKTGTLSNVHCLSGYLVTKKGETLIFSFMNTNFTVPTREIRTRMEEFLVLIRDNY